MTDPLRVEHRELKREVYKSRREFAGSRLGAFARAMLTAMDEYFGMRHQGVSREDACRGLEAVLRETWPGRTTQYPPQCERCEDTGWAQAACDHARRCDRKMCRGADVSWSHAMAVVCDCPKGDTFRRRQQSDDDELVSVGKMRRARKPASWSRMGR